MLEARQIALLPYATRKMINLWRKFKKWIIRVLIGGTAFAAGLSGVPQDIYNNLNVKVYTACDLQETKRISIASDLQNFKARNPDNSLRVLNSQEKASIKSCEISKRGTEFAGIYNSTQYGVKIEIIGEVKNIEINSQHGIELFAKAWRGTQQLGFGKDGSVEIERFRIFNPPILVDDPNGIIIREWTDDITGELKQRKLREDPIEAIRQVIAHNAKIVGKDNGKIVVGKIGNTTSTFYPAAGANSPADGRTRQQHLPKGSGATWATVIGGAGNEANSSGDGDSGMQMESDSATDKWTQVGRAAWMFDTSTIGADNIDSSTISFYGSAKGDNLSITPDINVYSAAPAATNDVVAGDYDSYGSTAFSSVITLANISTTAYNDFSLNASGITNISKTGVSKFGTRNANYDVAAVAPTWSNDTGSWLFFNTADQAGTTKDPKLVVVHSVAAAGINKGYIIIEE